MKLISRTTCYSMLLILILLTYSLFSPSLPLPSPPLPLPSPVQGSQILQCYNAHNSYLFAIQAYNSRCEAQYKTTLPELLDVSGGVAEGVASVLIRILKWGVQKGNSEALVWNPAPVLRERHYCAIDCCVLACV